MEKIKSILTGEHLKNAAAVFLGYVVASVAIDYVTRYIAAVVPAEKKFDDVVSALLVVVVFAFVPIQTKALVLGATIVLIEKVLFAFGIDLVGMLRAGYVQIANPT